jgi:hypothetical protein
MYNRAIQAFGLQGLLRGRGEAGAPAQPVFGLLFRRALIPEPGPVFTSGRAARLVSVRAWMWAKWAGFSARVKNAETGYQSQSPRDTTFIF